MDWIREPEKKTPVMDRADVIVCGGGAAGIAAAVSAARNGAEVLLIEKYGFLGGLITAGLVITTPPLDNGINSEIARRLRKRSAYIRCRKSGSATAADKLTAFDPNCIKVEFLRMLEERKVDILLHTHITQSFVENGVIKGVIVETKAGRFAILGSIVIDATGEADVAAFCGAPLRTINKPITMMFTMAGVDVEKALGRLGTWTGLRRFVRDAIASGDLPFDLGVTPDFGAPGVHAEQLVSEDTICVWGGMLLASDVLDPRERTRAEIVTQEHALRLASFLGKNLPGFERARIEQMAPEVGIRATRSIEGKSVPSKEAVISGKFEDAVAKPYARRSMRVPLGSLLPLKVENLLVAGRCISAQEEIMGQMRLIPVCFATGQAAGTAAAVALDNGGLLREINVSMLQRRLTEQSMKLG